jgi:hypothetical protein
MVVTHKKTFFFAPRNAILVMEMWRVLASLSPFQGCQMADLQTKNPVFG